MADILPDQMPRLWHQRDTIILIDCYWY